MYKSCVQIRSSMSDCILLISAVSNNNWNYFSRFLGNSVYTLLIQEAVQDIDI